MARVSLVVLATLFAISISVQNAIAQAASDLSSWNDGPTKESIVKFVEAVTDENSPDYVEPSKRIAVFDNDGTLWCEQPIYPQVEFIVSRRNMLKIILK